VYGLVVESRLCQIGRTMESFGKIIKSLITYQSCKSDACAAGSPGLPEANRSAAQWVPAQLQTKNALSHREIPSEAAIFAGKWMQPTLILNSSIASPGRHGNKRELHNS
jgi:hypothetical protein